MQGAEAASDIHRLAATSAQQAGALSDGCSAASLAAAPLEAALVAALPKEGAISRGCALGSTLYP